MTPRTFYETPEHPAPVGAGCFRLCSAVLAAWLAAPATAFGEGPALGSVEAGPGVARLDYREYGPTGRILDRESGFVPSATVAAEVRPSRWLARLAASAGEGRLRYEGMTQAANPAFDHLPVESTSRAQVLSVEVLGGAFVDSGRRLALQAGASWHAWRREIEPATVFSAYGVPARVPELHEDYSWLELRAGVRATFLRTGRADWLLDARVLRVVGGRVVVERAAGDATLRVADRTGGRMGVGVRVAIATRWDLLVEGHGALWRFGEGPVDGASRLYEPESESRTAGIDARVAAAF